MPDEYISREKTLALLKSLGSRDYRREKGTIQDAIKMISSAEYTPAADVAPVVHGRWGKNEFLSDDVNSAAACSLCGELIGWFGNDFPPYCPYCGARMDGGCENA